VFSQSSSEIGNPHGNFIAAVYIQSGCFSMAVTHQNSDLLTLVKIRYYPSERLLGNF
jgi:hypothetical protein